MKTGICTTVQNVATLKNSVPDYVEVNITVIAKMTECEFEQYKNFISENSLIIEAANCFFPGDFRLCGNGFDPDAVLEYSKIAIKRLSELKVKICVVGSGKARAVGENENYDKCYADLLGICKKIGDIAEKYAITICIEPLNKNETNMITTVAEGAKFVRELNHPNVKLLADFYHMALENESFEVIYENRDIIEHVHIANPDKRKFPLESDSYDYNAARDILKESGYDKRISIEASGALDFETFAGESIGFINRLFK